MRIIKDNKGFTLVEVLAVIVVIAVISGIAIPNVFNTINAGKEKSLEILKKNIKTASVTMFEEVNNGIDIYRYNASGTKINTKVQISSNAISVNLQTLVSNGYLRGTSDNNKKVLLEPMKGQNIGGCEITITKNIDTEHNNKVSYSITNDSTSNSSCPSY